MALARCSCGGQRFFRSYGNQLPLYLGEQPEQGHRDRAVIGLTKMAQIADLSYDRLAWCNNWDLREEQKALKRRIGRIVLTMNVI